MRALSFLAFLSALFIVFFIILLSIYLSFFYIRPINLLESKVFIIKKGEARNNIIDHLYSQEIIQDKTLLKIIAYYQNFLHKGKNSYKQGEYLIDKNDTPKEIVSKFTKGKVYYRQFTIKEGMTNYEIYDLFDNETILSGEIVKNKYIEGSFLPNTYYYTSNETKMEKLKMMHDNMLLALKNLWSNQDKILPLKTKEQILILASIIEKEAGNEEEKPIIASIFINRLRKGMRLQSDPTIIYGITKGRYRFDKSISKADIKNFSEFNTYKINGLPKTPICNPSKSSIKAVLNPKKTKFLYFVANGKGGHFFSENLEKHNKYVRIFRNMVRNY